MSGYLLKPASADALARIDWSEGYLEPGETVVEDMGWSIVPGTGNGDAAVISQAVEPRASVAQIAKGVPGRVYQVCARARTSLGAVDCRVRFRGRGGSMNLVELTAPGSAAIPVAAFRDHLQMGRGFADDGGQDALLEAYLRAAIAAVEARTGKIVLEKQLSWELTRWHACDRQGLPVGPISRIDSLVLITAAGTETLVDPVVYRLRKDLYRPEIQAGSLPTIPSGGSVRITFAAGFGPDWGDVPPDLAQAVFMLAASNYEARAGEHGKGATMPFSVLALIERYKTVRLLGDVL